MGDGKFLGILVLAIIVTLLITGPFLLIFMAIFGLLNLILPNSISLPWLGEVGFLGLWTEGLVSKTAWVFWTFLMSPLIVAIIGFLLEPIVDAVEARHYPRLPKVRRRSVGDNVFAAVKLLGVMLCVSLGAWIVAGLTPLPASLVFVLAAGYLIAREYFETVALRRMPGPQAKAALNRQILPLWATGCALALTLNVPILNLFTPIVGVAVFAHLFHMSQSAQAN